MRTAFCLYPCTGAFVGQMYTESLYYMPGSVPTAKQPVEVSLYVGSRQSHYTRKYNKGYTGQVCYFYYE